jgi:SAM-dependent methyltransferase
MKRILNVGCAGDTYGTDFIDLYPSREDVIKLDVNRKKFPYKDGTFDEVYARQLVAHLWNPMNFFRESLRVLKKGGRLYITTDSAGLRGWWSQMCFGSYDKKHGDMDRYYMLHTTNTVKNLAEVAGFNDIDTRYEFIITFKELTWKLKLMFIWYHFLSIISKRFTPNIVLEARKS